MSKMSKEEIVKHLSRIEQDEDENHVVMLTKEKIDAIKYAINIINQTSVDYKAMEIEIKDHIYNTISSKTYGDKPDMTPDQLGYYITGMNDMAKYILYSMETDEVL